MLAKWSNSEMDQPLITASLDDLKLQIGEDLQLMADEIEKSVAALMWFRVSDYSTVRREFTYYNEMKFTAERANLTDDESNELCKLKSWGFSLFCRVQTRTHIFKRFYRQRSTISFSVFVIE